MAFSSSFRARPLAALASLFTVAVLGTACIGVVPAECQMICSDSVDASVEIARASSAGVLEVETCLNERCVTVEATQSDAFENSLFREVDVNGTTVTVHVFRFAEPNRWTASVDWQAVPSEGDVVTARVREGDGTTLIDAQGVVGEVTTMGGCDGNVCSQSLVQLEPIGAQ